MIFYRRAQAVIHLFIVSASGNLTSSVVGSVCSQMSPSRGLIRTIYPYRVLSMADAVRSAGLDKFYTREPIALSCIEEVGLLRPWSEWTAVVEPSAGNGAFLKQIPCANRIGIDISPDSPGILKQDFLTWAPAEPGTYLVIGNPPFGIACSLAIKFFNHAAGWATTIAFIVPRTFRRISIQNKLHRNFHLVSDTEIPMTPCSFEPTMMAKCCFQIWSRSQEERTKIVLPLSHPHWTFLEYGVLDATGQPTCPQSADFALRAYGGACGQIVKNGLASLRPKSWHWIKSIIDPVELERRFKTLDYSISKDTARQNSIGRGELIRLYSTCYPL